MLFYICDHNRKCSASPSCKKNGGDCIHCTDPANAKYGAITDEPGNHPDRFEAENFDIGHGKVVTYYWEFEQNLEESCTEEASVDEGI